jgi:hypothetical protein
LELLEKFVNKMAEKAMGTTEHPGESLDDTVFEPSADADRFTKPKWPEFQFEKQKRRLQERKIP